MKYFFIISIAIFFFILATNTTAEDVNESASFISSITWNWKDFHFDKLPSDYIKHPFVILHISLLTLLIISFFTSLAKLIIYTKHKNVEATIYRINKRYHFFAELFLLIGLAGAAISIQSAINVETLLTLSSASTENTTTQRNMTDVIKSGLVFSAAGIILAILSYSLRTFLLHFYWKDLNEEKRLEKEKLQNVSEIYPLLRSFLSQENSTTTTSIITLSQALERVEKQNETSLDALTEKSNQNIEQLSNLIEKVQVALNEQLQKNLELQEIFIKNTNSIVERLENIQQPLLSIIIDLERSQKDFKEQLVQQVKNFIESHKNWNEGSIVTLKMSFEQSYKLWEKHLEELYTQLGENLQIKYLEHDSQVQGLLEGVKIKNEEIRLKLEELLKELQSIITLDFITSIGNCSKELENSFSEYFEKSTQVCEINKINEEIVRSTIEKYLPQKKTILERIVAIVKRDK